MSARNVISGNQQEGVRIEGAGSTGNLVKGNFIGTDPSGTIAEGNALSPPPGAAVAGIGISLSDFNTIGGSVAGAGNLISGNAAGVLIQGGRGNLVQGDFIGTDVTGGLALPNTGFGVEITDGPGPLQFAQNNSVGGTPAGAGDTIAFNTGAGVLVKGSPNTTANAILGNSIFSNSALGIDLGGDGATAPTPGAHSGPNSLTNSPTISAVTPGASSTVVQGSYNGPSSATVRLEFFASPSCDPTGFGEGKTFLGFVSVSTDASGNASFAPTFQTVVPIGQSVTATATDPANDTSEFSACRLSALPIPIVPPVIVPPVIAPPVKGSISGLAFSPALFFAAPSGPTVMAAKRVYGTIVSYRDSQPAITTFTVQRPAAGREHGKACGKPNKKNHRGKRCTRQVDVGSFTHTDSAGANHFRFTGRLGGHKLARGEYRMRAVPHDAAGDGPTVYRTFSVKG